MARTGNFYILTSPDGKTGIFHQLGSVNRSKVCVQNCFVEKFGRGKVTIGRGMFIVGREGGGNIAIGSKYGVGYFDTPEGPYLVERITPSDPRYLGSSIINEYSEFFGKRHVKAVIEDVPVKTSKAGKAAYHVHVKAVKLINDLLETLGYVRHENIQPLRHAHAAKRKK